MLSAELGTIIVMMRERQVQEPSELVIWSASALLGVVVGVGMAFVLWAQLHRTGEPLMLDSAVFSLGLGLGMIGLALRAFATRLFLVVLGCALLIAFFTGAGAFAALAG